MADAVHFLTINGVQVSAQPGTRLLDVLREQRIDIPTLCDHKGLTPWGSCRLCLVEVVERGRRRLVASCLYPVERASSVDTESPRVRKARRYLLTLLLNRNGNAKIVQQLAARYGVTSRQCFFDRREEGNCILCLRCVRACNIQGHSAIGTAFRGQTKKISSPFDEPPPDCIGCAACAAVCPTGAIEVIEDEVSRKIWGRTFEMVRCERCGQVLATREQLAWARRKLGYELDDKLCPRCRQRTEAGLMVKI
ncbi:MAG: 2Fe-2S iron-sulfur cluster-binding protein [bacterium]|jgi:bidirectional [NiFe] hydrogenase diaphorase subunit